jgi:hypothetical protein
MCTGNLCHSVRYAVQLLGAKHTPADIVVIACEIALFLRLASNSTISEEAEIGRCSIRIPVLGFQGPEDNRAFPEKEDIRRWCLSAS